MGPALKATTGVLKHLSQLNMTFADNESLDDTIAQDSRLLDQRIANRLAQVQSFNNNLEILLRGCTSTSYLLEQVATSKNQKIAQDQSELITLLTKSTLEDSGTVRIITVIFLVYLSSSTVAVSKWAPFKDRNFDN